jgi:LytS/YehU family sensor histidine kinase
LGQFLRASFDQQERLLVPLEEELAVVRAYLDIEALRLGDRLKVEQTVDPGLLKVLMPPFSLQPLVENAVQHGLHSSSRAGQLRLEVRPIGPWVEMNVNDDGQGVTAVSSVRDLFKIRAKDLSIPGNQLPTGCRSPANARCKPSISSFFICINA